MNTAAVIGLLKTIPDDSIYSAEAQELIEQLESETSFSDKLAYQTDMAHLAELRDEIAQLNTALGIKNGTIEQLKARVAEPVPKQLQAHAAPDVLFDGFAVLNALSDKAKQRTSAENVSDVLDAVVKLLRSEQADTQQATARQVQVGRQLVPIEPTEEMRTHAKDHLAEEGMVVSDWLIDTIYTEMLAAAPQAEPGRGWIECSKQMPPSGQTVLAFYLNSYGMGRRIRAQHVDAWTIQVDDLSDPDTECVEYSEQEDAYYLLAGWYECIDNWEDYSRIAVNEGTITHWMPLPEPPAVPTKQAGGEL